VVRPEGPAGPEEMEDDEAGANTQDDFPHNVGSPRDSWKTHPTATASTNSN